MAGGGMVRLGQVPLDTASVVLQAGLVSGTAGLGAVGGLQHQTAGAGRVLAGALALLLPQRRKPAAGHRGTHAHQRGQQTHRWANRHTKGYT